MDFVTLAGFLMTICHLALEIRGEEGESKFDFFFTRTHEICHDVSSDRPDYDLFDKA